jgi:hypothetical protein
MALCMGSSDLEGPERDQGICCWPRVHSRLALLILWVARIASHPAAHARGRLNSLAHAEATPTDAITNRADVCPHCQTKTM